MATLVGKYKGHEIKGEPSKDGEFKILSWTFDGKPAPQKTAKGIVGNAFKTSSAAGVAVYERMNRDYGYPENLTGRHLKFSGENGEKPARAPKAAKAEKETAKASKNGASEPEETKKSARAKKGGADPKAPSGEAEKGGRRARRQRKPTPLISRMTATKEGDPQADVPKGRTKFWCQACQASFVAKSLPDGQTPDECPNGHSADDPEFQRVLGGEEQLEELAI